MMPCPRCGTPAILMAGEEFQLLDCGFCDDVIDLSLIDQELPELEPERPEPCRSVAGSAECDEGFG